MTSEMIWLAIMMLGLAIGVAIDMHDLRSDIKRLRVAVSGQSDELERCRVRLSEHDRAVAQAQTMARDAQIECAQLQAQEHVHVLDRQVGQELRRLRGVGP